MNRRHFLCTLTALAVAPFLRIPAPTTGVAISTWTVVAAESTTFSVGDVFTIAAESGTSNHGASYSDRRVRTAR